jgi:uncharacterized repeat protein (TIGR01451 family)
LSPSLFDVTITSNSNLNPFFPGGTLYDGWCIARDVEIRVPSTYSAYVYSSYELGYLATVPTLASGTNLGNLDSVNWLLGYYAANPNIAYGDIQGAMWKLLGWGPIVTWVGPQSAVNIDALTALALTHDGYVPDVGQAIGIVLDPVSGSLHNQPILIQAKAAKLGDYVWNDLNANGVQDANETGIAGATVQLVRDINNDGDFNDANELLATTATDAAGHYAFIGLTPALTYQVRFLLPTGYDSVSPRQADGSTSSNNNSDALVSNVVVLSSGEYNSTLDAGFYRKASLGDRLWVDANGNGQQDAGEAGISGQTVTLIGGGADGLINGIGDTTAATVTGANGAYAFTGLTPGVEYQVQFSKPAGSVFTGTDIGNDVSDSDANAMTGKTQVVTLVSGENNTTLDAGVFNPAMLSGYVYQDVGNDGVRNSEPAIAGVTLTLTGTDGAGNAVAATTTTDANGFYQFTALPPGTYTVSQTQPAAYADGKETAGSTGGNISINDVISGIVLASGSNSVENNFGELLKASLGDRLWVDANGNGQQDAGEAGITGQTVTLIGGGADGLINGIGDTTMTTVTGANGAYAFTGLTPGVEYQIQFSKPAGTVFTGTDIGSDVSDSDANTVTGKTQIITLSQGENNTTLDAGVYTPAMLSGYVYQDVGNDGIRNSEPAIAGVTLTLTGTDGAGNAVTSTTTTDANGFYEFSALPPGTYTISQTQPAAYADGKETAGTTGGNIAVNDVISNILLISGSNSVENNFGELLKASLGDRLWVDANGNGQQDVGEAGITGQTVTLIGGGADGVINGIGDTTAATVTGADGAYAFTGLTPGVEYQVEFSKPAGTVFTGTDIGSDVSDSDANTVTGKTAVITLSQGENNTTLDAGVYTPAVLSGYVYQDVGNDGVRNSEPAIAGVTLTLTGTDGAGNAVTATTTTDGNGFYQFSALPPGTYTVSQTQPAAYADGKETAGTTGGNIAVNDVISNILLISGSNSVENNFGELLKASLGDRLWVDANGNGQHDVGEAGITGQTVTLIGGGADGVINGIGDTTATTVTGADGAYAFTGLTPGVEYQVQFSKPAGSVFTGTDIGNDTSDSDANSVTGKTQIITLSQGENDATLDAGVYTPAVLSGYVYQDVGNDGVRNAEPGIAGVTLTLTGTDGAGNAVTATTTTAANGFYQFTALPPGTYTVSQTQPAAYADGKETAGSTGGNIAVNDVISGIVLASGSNSVENNFGELLKASLGDRLWIDANGNGQQDTGEAGITGQTVTLIGGGADGLINGIGDTTASTVTGANGAYAFTGLTPGVEYQVQFSKPAGTVFTGTDIGNDLSDSDANTITGKTQIITLSQGENNTTLDAGVYTPAVLSGYVYQDVGNDGVRNAEPGIAGVTLTLTGTDGSGNAVTATTTTAANGFYQFAALPPGTYTVSQTQPAAYADGKETAGSTGGIITVNDLISNIVLASGSNSVENNFGELLRASLGDRLWIDANGNGQQDTGEAGITGQTITLIGGGADGLINGIGDTTATTVTGANGLYAFACLTPGVQYQVQFSKPAGTVFTGTDIGNDASDSDAGATGLTQIVTLAPGENNLTLDAGVYATASLGDRVWVDANGNGIQDSGEANVAGVVVNLVNAGGSVIATRTTGADGLYLFNNLAPGSYRADFNLATLPAGYSVTTKNAAGSTTANDSDADPVTGRTSYTTLDSGETDSSWDLGIRATVGIDIEKLVHGEYVVQGHGTLEGLTPGFWKNHTAAGPAPLSGWPETGLSPGASYESLFGVDVPGSAPTLLQALGSNGGGVDALLRHSAAALLNAADPFIDYMYTSAQVISMVRAAFSSGNFEATKDLFATQNELGADLTNLATASTTVVTADVDADTAGSGPALPVGATAVFTYLVKTTGSVELGNISVTDSRIATLTFLGGDTDHDGKLDVNETWTYKASETVVAGADIVNIGTATGRDLVSGTTVSDADSAHYSSTAPNQALGDRLWLDSNANGMQDAGEQGVGGATVQLKATNGTVLQTTTTDSNGNYLFDVAAGSYMVTFQTPAGYVVSARDVGGNDSTDSDIDATSKTTGTITIGAGEQNLKVDAGIYQTASLGDRLWVDTNGNGQQDDGATGLSGQTITLAGGGADGLLSTTSDNTAATITTGADGAYRFNGLTPGVEYQVQFSKPAGYNYTGADIGNDSSDSDANASTGKSPIVKLASGEYNATIDAGLVAAASDLSITKSDGVTSVVPGQTVTYTIVARNTGSASALNTLVSDTMSSDLTNISWTSVAAGGASGNLASGTGNISDYVNLTPGSTVTYTVTAKIAALSALESVADFGAGANNTNLGQNETINGIRADAYYISSGTYRTTNTVLWGRNVPSDHGLGVWSNGEPDPIAGGGDVNEISNQLNNEVIRLTKPTGEQWSSLWVSSLDVGGSGNAELGTLYWSNSATPDLATLTTKFVFKYGDFGLGEEEGNILSLNPPGFDATAKYVFFVAGPNPSGTNNDYLLWKAGTIPAQISNTATVTAPTGFTDSNTANNTATDTDNVTIPAAVIVRGSIGDRVWEDMNYNGVQDAGENGVAGVTVRLLDAGSNAVMATTTTNASGNYLFNNLNAGNYKVEVVKPTGYFITRQNATADASDSDVGTADGRTAAISLSTGENDLSVDAGLYRKASIGDKVWADLDMDGIQDVSEEGIAGIKVSLLNAANVTIATATTNSSGNYNFSNLDPGTYSLVFDKASVVYKGYNMSDYAWGVKNAGSNDSIDSDVVGNAVAKTNVTHTDAIVLVSGENDLTWDAAITPIVIDLNGDGIRTVSLADAAGSFDLLGNGAPIASGWLSGSDGFLAVDKDGNGRIDSIAELFGGAAKGAGFAQLAAYDSNNDGVVDAGDADFASLRIWRDDNGNHVTDAGELLSLAQAGVLSLAVAHTDLPFIDAQGNLHLERSAATLANGATVDMTDVYLAIGAKDALAANTPSLAQLMEEPAQPAADALIELTGRRSEHHLDGGLSPLMYG